jgi:hypothetical protein
LCVDSITRYVTLTPSSIAHLGEVEVTQAVKKFSAHMEAGSSLLCLQDPTTGPALSHMNPVYILKYFL